MRNKRTMHRAFLRKSGRRQRGMTLIDTMIGMFILSIGALSFCALMPIMARGQKMSQEVSVANQIATRELENLRLLGFNSLNATDIYSVGLCEAYSGSGPIIFSHVVQDEAKRLSAATALKNGVGEVTITDVSANLRSVIVTVNWTSASNKSRTLSLSTLVGKNYQ